MKLCIASFTVLLFAGLVPAADDLETSFGKLKQAESSKDAASVKQLAAQTCSLARAVIASPAPESDAEKGTWNERVSYARSVELHTEYSLFSTAIAGPPATTIDLLAALEAQNPKSKYLADAYPAYFLALTKTGAAAKIPAVAEKAVGNFPDDEDLLLVLADTALSRSQNDRAQAYAKRLVAALSKRSRPDNVPAAAWEQKKRAGMGRGYWIGGVVAAGKNQYAEADTQLRAALPLIQDNESMLAAALFNLGVVNYQIGRMTANKARVLEAAKFSDRVAAMKSPYSAQAWKNAHIMRTEALKMP